MAFQALTIELNANVQKLAADLDQAQQLSAQAQARVTQAAQDAGRAIGDAANQADFGDLSDSAKAAAASMDAMRNATVATGTAADAARSKLALMFEEFDRKAGEAYDKMASGAKTAGIVLSVAATAAVAATAYAIARSVAGAVSLAVDGAAAIARFATDVDAYKSKYIDALDAQNEKVKELQKSLVTTAQAASALDLAFRQQGVPKDDYVSVYSATDTAIRKAIDDQEHLNRAMADARQTGDDDRIEAASTAVDKYTNAFRKLGIEYQDANGKALDTTTVIANVAKALGEYAQGYDRNAASAALGVGSFEKVANAAKVTQAALDTANERNRAYFLTIGPNTQAALDEYHKAVDGFQTESDLMSQGFKAAIAEAILPTLAGLADFFKEGFPATVGVFREVLTGVIAVLETFKLAAEGAYELVAASFSALEISVDSAMRGVQKALHFDFSGAKAEVDQGAKAIEQRFGTMLDNLTRNRDQAIANIDLVAGKESVDSKPKLGDRPFDPGYRRFNAHDWDEPPKTPAPKGGSTPNVDVAKKQLELQMKALELFIADERTQLTERDEFLTLYYQHSDISIRDYFAHRKDAQDEYVVNARKGYQEEIADLDAYIVKTKANGDIGDDQKTARVTEAQTKLVEVRNKLRKVEADAAQETLKDWFAQRDAVEQYRDTLNDLAAQIKTFSGDTAGAFEISFAAQYRKLQRQLVATRDSSTSTVDEREEAVAALANLDRIHQQGAATARLNDLSSQRSVILGDLANAQARIDLAVSTGQKSELQGLADQSAANQARLASLRAIADAYERIAESSANPQDRVNADAIRVELERLQTQTDLVADRFNELGRSVSENFFDKLTDRTTSLKDKLKSLGDDLAKQLNQLTAKSAAASLFGKDGALAGFGKTLSQFFPASDDASKASSDSGDGMGAFLEKLLGGDRSGGTSGVTALNAVAAPAALSLSLLDKAATAAADSLAGLSFAKGGSEGTDFAAGYLKDLFPSASGNVFDGGQLVPFASGGVITSPIVFPMRGGMGLAGEAGPEAIMPLKRHSSGRLGVETSGTAGGNSFVTINNTYRDPKSRQSQAQITGTYLRALDRRRRTSSA